MTPSVPDQARLQKRVLRTLASGQIVGSGALGSAVTLGAFVLQDALGHDTPWAGLATAMFTAGAAVLAQPLSRIMRRGGRRPGLVTGYAVAALGAVFAAVAVEARLVPLFLVGLLMYGGGQASNLFARYTATDLARPEERSRAMARVVFGSTFGAVFGPLLVTPAELAGEAWFGLDHYTGPFVVSAVFFLGAGLNVALRLRPDPLEVLGMIGRAAPGTPGNGSFLGALRVIAATPRARVGLVAMAVSQAAMVGVMAMTPLHMRMHGAETASQWVVAVHIAGMYAFSPLIGRFADRYGRRASILTGAAVLVVAGLLGLLLGEDMPAMFPALFALGLGWNFGLIGGSTLVSESVPAQGRVAVQGAADLLMSGCGALAALVSGLLHAAIGFGPLAGIALVAAAGLGIFTAVALRRVPDGDVQPATLAA